jgi:hypothetical protein
MSKRTLHLRTFQTQEMDTETEIKLIIQKKEETINLFGVFFIFGKP